jgi:hypothetical protein
MDWIRVDLLMRERYRRELTKEEIDYLQAAAIGDLKRFRNISKKTAKQEVGASR